MSTFQNFNRLAFKLGRVLPAVLAILILILTMAPDSRALSILFTESDRGRAIVLQPDGKIMSVGEAQAPAGAGVARYLPNGDLDESFDSDGKATIRFPGAINDGYAAALQADGKIVVVGTNNGRYWPRSFDRDIALARLNPDGSLDPGFGRNGRVETNFFEEPPLLINAPFTDSIGVPLVGWRSNDIANAVAIQPDGRILVAGSVRLKDRNLDFALARYLPDGSLDPSFGADGKAFFDLGTADDEAFAMSLLPDGRILLAGKSGEDFGVIRVLSDGSLDPGFGVAGAVATDFDGAHDDVARSLAILSDGKIIVIGSSIESIAMAQYHSDGDLDENFGVAGKATAKYDGLEGASGEGMALQADGNILVVGTFGFKIGVARFLPDGILDPSFGSGGWAVAGYEQTGEGHDVAVLPNGDILALGFVKAYLDDDFALARFSSDGTPNLDFGFSGQTTTDFSFQPQIPEPVPAPYRPDLHVGTSRNGQIGDDIYEGVANNNGNFLIQKIFAKAKRGRTSAFFFTVENDGSELDSIAVRSKGSWRDVRVRIRQHSPSRGNVTAGFATRRFVLQNRAPEARAGFVVQMTPRRRLRGLRSLILTAISESEDARRDTVVPTIGPGARVAEFILNRR